eukprot:CAMPEP_0198265960 /NCGR_PEP_ID=MMETSP1447-20131203/25760_1 /TAXON_ID=420782 /ORGANISM="Chaetoceros dichaeta, Strain CCMP1751" /LENGTH=38 /DNA_ID= /DNA_START= /DNA_END= /DNA_ORIENTATION=
MGTDSGGLQQQNPMQNLLKLDNDADENTENPLPDDGCQ